MKGRALEKGDVGSLLNADAELVRGKRVVQMEDILYVFWGVD